MMNRFFCFILLSLLLFALPLKGNGSSIGNEDNGIRISRDTVTYICSHFILDRYVTLADMLSEMPGMSVEEDGSVMVYGQPLTKIVVKDMGYFFDDVAITVNNFPINLIEKIIVYDRTSLRESDLKVADLDEPEKKMNIVLKKEALESLSGSADIEAGAVFSGERFLHDSGVILQDNRNNQNLTLLTKYSNNLYLEPQEAVAGMEPGNEGLLEKYESGVNYSSPQVGKFKYKLAGTYISYLSKAERTASRQTFTQENSYLLSKMQYNDTYDKNVLNITGEINRADKGFPYYEMTPSFIYTGVNSDSYIDVNTTQGADRLNSFRGNTYQKSKGFTHKNKMYVSFKNLGNARRVFLMNLGYHFDHVDADRKEYTNMLYEKDGSSEVLNLYYDGRSKDYGYDAYFTYVEPLAKYWDLNAKIESKYAFTLNDKEAYNYTGNQGDRFIPSFDDKGLYTSYNEGYSSLTKNKYFSNKGRLLAQYKKGETILQFGGLVQGVYNEVYGENAGISTLTGKGEYLWDWSPFLNFKTIGKNGRTLMVNYSGISMNLANHLITPAPKINDPSLITFGNVYLQPSFNNQIQFHYAFNSKKNFNLMYLNFKVDRKRRDIVEAIWYDQDGMQYAVPVNSKKITRNFMLEYNFSNIPLNKQKSLVLNMNLNGGYRIYYSYQANKESNVIDLQNFSYTVFMERFWGKDPSGSDFYSGATGFSESRTKTAFIMWDLNLEYQLGDFKTIVGANAQRNIVKYSINEDANMNTWDFGSYMMMEYDIPAICRIKTELDYRMYDGYQSGYGKNTFCWNLMLYKNIGAFKIKVSAYDLLDNVSKMRRITTANYIQDTYSADLGRMLLLGASYQF
ncbi:MAG: hypothetical protein Q4A54_02585 [Parabacteroides sp.]|nr:hypothetical protein [Parabacteroides sp.]